MDSKFGESVVENLTPDPTIVTVETVAEMPGGVTQSVTLINLEQCSLCSTFYEQPKPQPIPKPDLNRLICKILEIQPGGTPEESQAFFGKYIQICTECTQKVRKYDQLRLEMESLKNDVVASVVDTLVHIRPCGKTPIHSMKNHIFKRWSTVKVGDSEVVVTSTSLSKPVRGFVISGSSAEQKSEGNESAIPEKSPNGSTVSQWVYGIVDPSDPNISNMGVAEVIVSAPRDFALASNESSMDGENPDYFEEDGKDWSSKEKQTGSNAVKKKRIYRPRKKVQPAFQPGRSKNLESEQLSNANTSPPPYFCDDCGRVFAKNVTLKIHQRNYCTKNEGGRKKICPLCLKDFTTGCWQDLKKHFDEVHPDASVEKCMTCKMELLPTTLKSHTCGIKAINYSILEPDFKCDICSKAYVTRCNLTDHIRRKHIDATKFTCESCSKTFLSKMLFEEHKLTHRKRLTKFECKECGHFSASAYSLQVHTRIHTGELPYKCTVCGKLFRCKSVLKNHSVTHSKEKKFSCEICGMKFGLRGTMSRHWKRHKLPDTNYTKNCPICPLKKFRKIFALKDHMQNNHPDTPEYDEVFKKFKDVDDRTKSSKKAFSNEMENEELTGDEKQIKKKKTRGRRKIKILPEVILSDTDNSDSSFEYSNPDPIYITNELESGDSSDSSSYKVLAKTPLKNDQLNEERRSSRKRKQKLPPDSSTTPDRIVERKFDVPTRVSLRQNKKVVFDS